MAERIARENEERQKSEEEMAKRLKASQEVGMTKLQSFLHLFEK